MQLTLFNPQGTVVKMFVILFDLTEMPPNSETFLRQRTFYMPSHETDASPVSAKWLRYLIHLRYPAHLSINKKSILLNNSILPLLCHQVSQFKIRSNPLAHRHPNDCVAQVGCRYGFGTHCRKLLRVEIFHTRPVQPTLLQPLRSYYEKYCLLQKWKKKKKIYRKKNYVMQKLKSSQRFFCNVLCVFRSAVISCLGWLRDQIFFFLSFLWLTGLSCLSRCFPVVVINTFPSLVKTNSIFRENEDFYRL